MDPIDAPLTDLAADPRPPDGGPPGAAEAGAPAAEERTFDQVRQAVVDARFPMLGQGYEPASVDEFLEELTSALDAVAPDDAAEGPDPELEERVAALRAEASSLESELDRLREEARDDAQALRAEADRDAALVRLEARSEAEAIVAAARAEAAEHHDAARRSAPVAPVDAPAGRTGDEPGAVSAVTVAIEAIRAIADLALDEGAGAEASGRGDVPAPDGLAGTDRPRPSTDDRVGEPTRLHAPRRSIDVLSEDDAAFLAGLRRGAGATAAPEEPATPARGMPEAAG